MASLITSQAKPIWDLFFNCHTPELISELSAVLTRDTAGIVTSYLLGKENPFGAAEWKRYFGVDVVDPPKLPPGFYAWWFGPDHVDPKKQCCQTHLPPVLRPAGISLYKLGELAKTPLERNAVEYATWPESSALKQNEHTQAGPACWLVLRKGVFDTKQQYEHQIQFIKTLNGYMGAAYVEEPSAIDLVTVIFARQVSTGECYLGDVSGMEQRVTYSRAKETVQDAGKTYQMIVGNFNMEILEVRHFSLETGFFLGIAGLRKF